MNKTTKQKQIIIAVFLLIASIFAIVLGSMGLYHNHTKYKKRDSITKGLVIQIDTIKARSTRLDIKVVFISENKKYVIENYIGSSGITYWFREIKERDSIEVLYNKEEPQYGKINIFEHLYDYIIIFGSFLIIGLIIFFGAILSFRNPYK